MKRYLGMTEQEMSENEVMWSEEQGDTEMATPDDASLRNVGISPGTIAGDLDNVEVAGEVPPGAEGAAGGGIPGAASTEAPGPGPNAADAAGEAGTLTQ